MIVSLSDFERDVRCLLGQNTHLQPLVDDPMQLSLSQMIRARAAEAVRQAHEEAPAEWLGPGIALEAEIEWDAGGHSGRVALPADFHRLIAFRMTDWQQPVTAPITPASPLYSLQRSPWPGLRGNPERPVCAIVPAPGGLALEFFSCASAASTVVDARYLPLPASGADPLFISPLCYPRALEIAAAGVK